MSNAMAWLALVSMFVILIGVVPSFVGLFSLMFHGFPGFEGSLRSAIIQIAIGAALIAFGGVGLHEYHLANVRPTPAHHAVAAIHHGQRHRPAEHPAGVIV